MNYAELVTAIQDYTENDESTFVSQIPQFTRSAEQKIYRAVRIPDTRTTDANISIGSGASVATLPTGFLLPLSFKIVAASIEYPVILKDESFLTEAFPALAVTERPRYYAIRSDTVMALAPQSDAAYTGTLNYLAFPTTIVTGSTSWLGTYAESALLYGALVEAAVFMKSPTMGGVYKTRLDEELLLLSKEAGLAHTDEYYGDTVVAT